MRGSGGGLHHRPFSLMGFKYVTVIIWEVCECIHYCQRQNGTTHDPIQPKGKKQKLWKMHNTNRANRDLKHYWLFSSVDVSNVLIPDRSIPVPRLWPHILSLPPNALIREHFHSQLSYPRLDCSSTTQVGWGGAAHLCRHFQSMLDYWFQSSYSMCLKNQFVAKDCILISFWGPGTLTAITPHY